jgi:hypothetical protein
VLVVVPLADVPSALRVMVVTLFVSMAPVVVHVLVVVQVVLSVVDVQGFGPASKPGPPSNGTSG